MSRTSSGDTVWQLQLMVQLAAGSQRTAFQTGQGLIKGSWCILHHGTGNILPHIQTDITSPIDGNRVSKGAEAQFQSPTGLGNQGEYTKVNRRHGEFKDTPWHIFIRIHNHALHLQFVFGLVHAVR